MTTLIHTDPISPPAVHPASEPVLGPVGDQTTTGGDRSLRALHHDETGAQAMEYAALACGGVGITGIIVQLLNSAPVQERLAQLFTGVVDTLGSALGGLF